MILLLICVACSIATSAAHERPFYETEEADILFEEFIQNHGKNYSDEQKQKRLAIFIENVKFINEKNLDNGAVYAINKFTDLSEEEFIRDWTGFKPMRSAQDSRKSYDLGNKRRYCKILFDHDVKTEDAPDQWDWRKEGAVTAVKNQFGCGSCWAFGTIGTIEGQHFIKNGKLVSFSEQELVDCSKHNGNCHGGFMTFALLDLIDIGGVQTEESYPYASGFQECRFNSSKAKTVKGCTQYAITNENKLKEVLFKRGPITTSINGPAISFYSGGIMRKSHCKSNEEFLNHAVLLVGYGTEYGVDYWIFKNSWGTEWGEEGFFRIHRGDNTCGIVTDMENCSAEM